MPTRYQPKGPRTRTWFACPLCGRDWKTHPPVLSELLIVLLREVLYPGRGGIRTVRTYGPHEVAPGSTWLGECKLAVARLARALGLQLTRQTVREVIRTVLPAKVERRLREQMEALRYWMRHAKGLEREVAKHRRVSSRSVRHRGVSDESIGVGFTRVTGGQVRNHGVVEEEW